MATRDSRRADALVVFGITGDLARKMTLRALYRLERRGLLDVPIVGVAAEDWSLEQLRRHAHAAIAATGEPLDAAVFDRFAARLRYVGGDFGDAGTFTQLGHELGGATSVVHYLEVPPSLFATVVAGLAGARLLGRDARVVVEKPFGHDLRSARALAHELHRHLDESQLYRIDHFLGKLGLRELLSLRYANAILEPVWNRNYVACVQITLAERIGVQDRGRFYDPVGALRDVVLNHCMQLLAATAMEAPAGDDPGTLKDAKWAVFRSMPDADPAAYVRGQYAGYREIEGVAADSRTETYAALRLEVDNWRWAGVPFFIRSGKRLPVTATEVRLVFRQPPRLGFLGGGRRAPAPNQLVITVDPQPGVRLVLDALRADAPGPREVDLDLDLLEQGGAPPQPYEVLLHAALSGDSTEFVRQDAVEETWRIAQPLLERPGAVEAYAPGSWGPAGAAALVADVGGWQGPSRPD